MKQTRPVIHGRDHGPGGADPIPNLSGGGGGALEWSDVGGAGTPPAVVAYGTLNNASSFSGTVADMTQLAATATDLSSMTAVTNGLKVTVAGMYVVAANAQVLVPAPYSVGRGTGIAVKKNTALLTGTQTYSAASNSGSTPWTTWVQVVAKFSLAVNDVLTLWARSLETTDGFGSPSANPVSVGFAGLVVWRLGA